MFGWLSKRSQKYRTGKTFNSSKNPLWVDNLLKGAAKEALTGHRYLKADIKGQAQTGDAFAQNWQGKGRERLA